MLKRIASNATANMANGAIGAGFQLGMTAIVARTGQANELAIWSLAASVAGFAPLLACNLASAVARRLAGAADEDRYNCVMQAGRSLSAAQLWIAVALAAVVALGLPYAYAELTAFSRWASSATVATYLLGSCWIVASQPEVGALMASHRNWPIAIATFVARSLALLTMAGTLALHQPIWLAVVMASLALWSGTLALRRQVAARAARVPTSTSQFRAERADMANVVGGFAVWSLTSAVIQALTVPIVAYFAPDQATAFFLAFTLVNIIVGATAAATNALMAPLAQLLGNGASSRAAKVATRATGAVWLLTTTLLLCAYAFLDAIVGAWVGPAAVGLPPLHLYFALLALQHGIRSAGGVSSILLAMGSRPSSIVRAPLPELAVAIGLALPLAATLGARWFVFGLSVAGAIGVWWVARVASKEVLGASNAGALTLLTRVGVLVALSAAGWGLLAWLSWNGPAR